MPFSQQSAHRAAYATPDDLAAGNVTGVGIAIDVNTNRPVTVYMNEEPARAAPTPPVQVPSAAPAPQPVIVQQAPRDPWAARIAASGGTVAGVAAAVGHYAPELANLAHAVAPVGIAVGIGALGLSLLKGSSAKVTVNISNSNTGSTSTSNATSNAHSAAGWKNNAG